MQTLLASIKQESGTAGLCGHPETPEDAQEQKQRYSIIQKLGEGSYSKVYLGTDNVTGTDVALKKAELNANGGITSASLREIAVLRALTHPNIVKLLDLLWDHHRLWLVFEYLEFDVYDYISTLKEPMPIALGSQPNRCLTFVVTSYLYQLLEGVRCCHAQQIYHRDLKPQNLLIDKAGRLKIADFGLARACHRKTKPLSLEVMTLWYRAPEILLGQTTYDSSVDLWAIGVIAVEFLTGQPLFPGDSEVDQLYKILSQLGTPTQQVMPGCTELPNWSVIVENLPHMERRPWSTVLPNAPDETIDFVKRLVNLNPALRMSASEALKHPFLSLVPVDKLYKTLFADQPTS